MLPFFLFNTVRGIGYGVNGSGHGTKQAGQGHCKTRITKERSKARGDSGQPEQGKEQAALEEKGEGTE